MFKFYFRNVEFGGLTVVVEAKDRESAFNAVRAHLERPQSWVLYHQRDEREAWMPIKATKIGIGIDGLAINDPRWPR